MGDATRPSLSFRLPAITRIVRSSPCALAIAALLVLNDKVQCFCHQNRRVLQAVTKNPGLFMDDYGSFESPPSPYGSSGGTNVASLSRLQDIFYDPRAERRPSRLVRAYIGSPGSATSIARNGDGTRCVVAGKEGNVSSSVITTPPLIIPIVALRIIRTQDPDAPSPSSLISGSSTRRTSKLLATGLGSAQIFEELNLWAHARPAESYLMTDVDWGRSSQYSGPAGVIFPRVSA